VITQEGPQRNEWEERINFIHSGDGPNDHHFVVETDEERLSIVRFGHDGNGRELAPRATVECRYQFGDPLSGNVGLETITQLDRKSVALYGELAADAEVLAFQNVMANATVRNPFDVVDGRAPEPAAKIIRNAPEAYRYRQLRAVTLEDYVRRAEEVDGVSRASATYAWTGSWRTVRITIDPGGTTELDPALRARVAAYLESVRLIGEDLEIRPPRFVPLDLQLAVCAAPEFWPEDVAFALRDELSDSFTADGRPAFFNPDRFTFGQALHASEIIGRAKAVTGVEHVISLTMKRWNDPSAPSDAIVNLRPNEIILVANDPDDMERGSITIDVRGGRR
jgi:predicted phage baseplate assembly protein